MPAKKKKPEQKPSSSEGKALIKAATKNKVDMFHVNNHAVKLIPKGAEAFSAMEAQRHAELDTIQTMGVQFVSTVPSVSSPIAPSTARDNFNGAF